jgi:hypothetical protein
MVNRPACASPVVPPDQGGQSDNEADHARPLQLMDVAGELMPDKRDLAGHRVHRVDPERRVTRRHQAEDGHQDEQQREERDEGAVRQVGDQHPAVVVAVLLHNAEDERGRLVPLLRTIRLPQQPLDGVHGVNAFRSCTPATHCHKCMRGLEPGVSAGNAWHA